MQKDCVKDIAERQYRKAMQKDGVKGIAEKQYRKAMQEACVKDTIVERQGEQLWIGFTVWIS